MLLQAQVTRWNRPPLTPETLGDTGLVTEAEPISRRATVCAGGGRTVLAVLAVCGLGCARRSSPPKPLLPDHAVLVAAARAAEAGYFPGHLYPGMMRYILGQWEAGKPRPYAAREVSRLLGDRDYQPVVLVEWGDMDLKYYRLLFLLTSETDYCLLNSRPPWDTPDGKPLALGVPPDISEKLSVPRSLVEKVTRILREKAVSESMPVRHGGNPRAYFLTYWLDGKCNTVARPFLGWDKETLREENDPVGSVMALLDEARDNAEGSGGFKKRTDATANDVKGDGR